MDGAIGMAATASLLLLLLATTCCRAASGLLSRPAFPLSSIPLYSPLSNQSPISRLIGWTATSLS